MASKLEAAMRPASIVAPVEVPRRRRWRTETNRLGKWRIALLGLGGAGLLAGLVALFPALPKRADPVAARKELAVSVALFRYGNATAARDHARAATKLDPNWGLAHAVLARSFLELDEGAAAEAELDRAKAAGFDPKRSHQLYAHAYLLQGDLERAIAEADQVAPRYAAYGARVKARALSVEGDVMGAWGLLSAVVEQHPEDSRAWADLGRVHQGAGDLVAASYSASRAVAADPYNVDAMTLRGELIRSQFGLVAALPWFEAALKRDPANHAALIEYAATLGEAGRYRDMLATARRAYEAKPGSPQALYLEAVLAARAGDTDTAHSLMERTGGKLGNMPAALLLGGSLDYANGAWQQAISQWGNLVGMQPKNIVARRLLAAALIRAGDNRGALDILRPVALRDDADTYTLSLVGRAFEQSGERNWAARFLDRAVVPGHDPASPFGSDASLAILGKAAAELKTPAAYVELVRGLIMAKQYPQALARAQILVKQNPGAPAAQVLVGDTYVAMGGFGAAVDAYRRAADMRFDEPTALRLVDALDRDGRRGEAAATLALFLSQNPANINALRLAAHWQIAAGQWDVAIATLESLRARVGNRDVAMLAELAYAYLGKGDADGAEVYAAAAYRLAPSNPAAADAWGMALLAQGNNEPAGQLLEKAASMSPRTAMLRWHLAQAYNVLGRKADAKLQATAALMDPAFPNRAEAQALARMPG